MTTSHSNPQGARQVRLCLRAATIARLLELQSQAVAAGHRKPSYSDLLDAAVARVPAGDIDALLMAGLEEDAA